MNLLSTCVDVVILINIWILICRVNKLEGSMNDNRMRSEVYVYYVNRDLRVAFLNRPREGLDYEGTIEQRISENTWKEVGSIVGTKWCEEDSLKHLMGGEG